MHKTQHEKSTHSYVAGDIFLRDWRIVDKCENYSSVNALPVHYFQGIHICSSLVFEDLIKYFFNKNLRLLSGISKLVYIYFTFVSSNESFFLLRFFYSLIPTRHYEKHYKRNTGSQFSNLSNSVDHHMGESPPINFNW